MDLRSQPALLARVRALYEAVWPGLPRRLEIAARCGWEWHRESEAFVDLEGGAPVAHAGVLAIPMVLSGERVTVAGIHAVGTHPDHRGRGHAHAAIAAAAAFARERFSAAQLTTGKPWLFAGHGFRSHVLQSFTVPRPAPSRRPLESGFRSLSPDVPSDVALLQRILPAREPVSLRVAAVDPGWLFGIDEVLATWGFARLAYAEDLDAVVAWEVQDGRLRLLDVAAARLPPLAELLARLPGEGERAALCFTPDRFEVEVLESEPAWPGEFLMTLGDWDAGGEPFGLSPLAHC